MLIISKIYGLVFQKGEEKTQICYSEDLSITKVFNEKKRIKDIKKLARSGPKKKNTKQKKKTVIQKSTNHTEFISQPNNFAPSNLYSAMNQTRFISQSNNFALFNQYSAMNQAGFISQSNYYFHVNLDSSMNHP